MRVVDMRFDARSVPRSQSPPVPQSQPASDSWPRSPVWVVFLLLVSALAVGQESREQAAGGAGGILLLVYTAEAVGREVIESEEGTLEWIPLAEIHTKDAVEDLPILIPLLFGVDAGAEPFSAHVSYDEADRIIFRLAGD